MLLQGVSVSGQGPLVVFLHSSLSSSKQWRGLAVKLSEHFTCINIDLLGYGEADKVSDPSNFTFDNEVHRILNIVDKSFSGQKFHIVGHSCGGAIALKMAVELPERILSLSLFEPVAFHLLENTEERKQQFLDFSQKIAALDRESATRVFVNFWNGDGFFEHLPLILQRLMVSDIDKVNMDFKGISAETYTLADVRNIQQPCLYLLGNNTKAISKELSNKIIASLACVSVCQLNCGHMGPVSHPELVETAVVKFLHSLLL